MEKALKKFQILTKTLPQRLIFYREQNSEAHFSAQAQNEIASIQVPLKEASLDIGLVYVGVQNKVNTRIFAQGEL
jgi:hypothetical protein